jgi:ABC-type multidrug transport system fused ATPase/permease subunit
MVARYFLDTLAAGESISRWLIILGVLLIAAAGLAALGTYLIARTAENVVLHARRGLLAQIMRLRIVAIDRIQPGDLLARVASDTTQLRAAATSNLVDLTTGAFQLLGIVALMAYLDWVLLGVVMGVTAAIVAAATTLLPRIRRASLQAQESMGVMAAALERVLAAFRTIKANGAEQREITVLYETTAQARDRGLQAARWMSIAGISTGLVVQVSFLTVLGIGGARVASGSLPVSSLIAFLLYLFYLTGPISQVVSAITGLQVGAAAVRRIAEVEALPVEDVRQSQTEEPAVTPPLPAEGVTVTMRDVVVRYHPNGPPQVTRLNFHLPATGLTAIVGPSGAGKSTIFALLERFYEPDSGQVCVGGLDIRAWPLSRLRGLIGYVEQDAPVLAGTLRDNLLLGAPGTSEHQLRRALELTQLESFVATLPDGIDTPIGHRGSTLSGGERQRIAIARALLRRPRILLLDEVTSQLDAVNEQALRDTVAALSRSTNVLMVAHRLSTVTGADRILVMEAGRLRATGTHAELLNSNPLYRSLASTQLLIDAPALQLNIDGIPRQQAARP